MPAKSSVVSATRCCLVLGVEPQSTSVYPKMKTDVTILDRKQEENKGADPGGWNARGKRSLKISSSRNRGKG